MRRSNVVQVLLALAIMAGVVQFSKAQTAAEGSATSDSSASSETTVSKEGAKSRTEVRSSNQANASEQESPAASQLKQGTKINGELVSNLDAQSVKPGDEVTARVTKDVKEHGRVIVHKGDRLMGRVTEAQASGSDKEGSRLGVSFDRLLSASSNQTTQLSTAISSILSTPGEPNTQDQDMDSGPLMGQGSVGSRGSIVGGGSARSSSGGLLGGATSTAGSTVGAVGSAAGGVTGSVADTGLAGSAASSTGLGNGTSALLATPRHAIRLNSETAGSSQTGANSVLSTRKGDLRLASGTRMEFKVIGQSH